MKCRHVSLEYICRTILSFTMGCTAGKIGSRKFKDSPIIDVNDMKIQTVLQLNPPSKKNCRSNNRVVSSASQKNRKHKKGEKRKESRHKSSRTKGGAKQTYDSKITAKYDIKAVIGKGSFSRVLRVEHRMTKQPYALKTIDTPNGREAFEAELSVLRRLNHPNVIKLIEVFESDNKVYMVMELATGGSLLDRLETKGCLTEDDSRDVMRMVVNGVKYLHSVGIAHRDLKPDNLLYYHPGKDSRIMITDFSFASTRKPSGNPYMHTVCGTPQYIAPEIVTRKPYTCAVDMWACGIITYIVLSGAFPFDSEQDAQIFKLILRGQVDMSESVWCDVSEEGKQFVLQLLRTDPAQRLSGPAALRHPWLTAARRCSPGGRAGGADLRSLRSSRSVGSSSGGSVHSLRSRRRVQAHHLDALSADPEVAALF